MISLTLSLALPAFSCDIHMMLIDVTIIMENNRILPMSSLLNMLPQPHEFTLGGSWVINK